ncbi:hypothetical protein FHG87_005904 [Trinorchestia longiramus]|nr:hypothetical protein FHG87_005904 [Trinorchestia longiramus]
MQTVAVFLVAFVAFVAAHPHSFPKTPEYRVCYEAMKAKVDRNEIKEIVKSCVAEQDGLQETIDGLAVEGEHKGKAYHRFMTMPENEEQALTLKKCIASKKGYLVNDQFDADKIKADILAKVAGTEQEANTQLGLDNCPTAPLDSFDMMEYAKCVMAYCATGEAPAE